jgi:hypothetical protein
MNARLEQPTYELHPLCVLFPRMAGADFDALREDIRANGLRTPIVLHDGMILDGGNRYRACIEAGVTPEFVEFAGGNLWSFVWSMNGSRRHLSPGQQAAIVASGKDWATAQTHGGSRRSDQGATLHLETVAQRAAESGASERTQKMADKVARTNPDLALKVAHGEVSLPKAHAQVSKPAHTQNDGEPIAPEPPKPAPKAKKQAAPEPQADTVESLRAELKDANQTIEELTSNLQYVNGEMAVMTPIFESDDRLAEALAQVKKLTAEVAGLRERVNGFMGESNQQIKRIKGLMAKLKKAGLE